MTSLADPLPHVCGISVEHIISWAADAGIDPDCLDDLAELLTWQAVQCEREQRERCELGEIHCHHPHIDTSPFIIRLHCGECDGCPECDCPACWRTLPTYLEAS